MTINNFAYVRTEAKCIVYSAGQHLFERPPVSENFANAVDTLNNNLDDYYAFLDSFGTHYVKTMKMGAKYGFESVFTKNALNTLK